MDFLAVVHSPDVERELASVRDKVRAVVIYPRSWRHADGAVVLEETTVSMFDTGLKAMALGAERCRILAIETGGSLTVLRRRLAVNRVMQQPVWAETGSEEGRLLAAAALLGTWKETTDATTLVAVSGLEPAVVESCWGQLRLLEDTPVREIGGVRGVTSKRDVLFAAAANVDEPMFRRFFEAAERVFTEKDPAWGLSAEAKRQLVYEVHEPPKHSGILKRGTADTLVFLAAYGKTLFGRRLDFDVEESVQAVIHRVLTPMSVERWESNSTWLPFFAEASPTSFLSWCEDDVRTEQPVLKTMMRPVELFSPCPRIGLLDALEVLAWEKTTFPRAVYLLAKLSEWSAEDNYGNTPMRSLRAIFRCRMPQTLADAETRLVVLKRLLKDYPKVGWELSLLQVRRDAIGTYASYNHKPRWRRRETEYGEPQAVVKALTERAVEWLLTQEKYSADQLCDLVKLRSQLDEEKNRQVMALIEAWYRRGQPWQAVEKVRETLRTTVILDQTVSTTIRSVAETLYGGTDSQNAVRRNLWLFESSWNVKLEGESNGNSVRRYQEREQRLLTRRLQAVDEILASCGAAGVLQWAEDAASPRDVGYTLAFVSNEAFRVVDFVTAVYRRPKGKEVVSLLLKSLQEKLPPVLQALHGRLSENDFATLLLWGPCEPAEWGAAECSEACSDTYWKNVEPSVASDENAEAVVRRLMKAGRPWAAFGTVEFRVDVLDIRLWAALLQQMAQTEPEHPSEVDDEAIRGVFKVVDASSALTDEEKVRLEFLFVGVLGVRFVGDVSAIPYLDHYVSEHPELFVQALQWQFRREDGKEEDHPWDERERKARWQQSYALLEALRRLPGSDAATAEERAAQLEAWIRAVQSRAETVGRREIADKCIGHLLARAPEEDDVWPPAAVCAVLEEFRSDAMASGKHPMPVVCRQTQ